MMGKPAMRFLTMRRVMMTNAWPKGGGRGDNIRIKSARSSHRIYTGHGRKQ